MTTTSSGTRLIDACDMAGPGELVHPYLGVRQVYCLACDVSERTDEGRMARVSLTFVDGGYEPVSHGQGQHTGCCAAAGR